MSKRLVAVILTRNEEAMIVDCIASLLGWTDAVVVWDACSTDATCRLARRAGAAVVQRPWDDYARQRQAALDAIEAEWLLFIDADERVPPALAAEIPTTLTASPHAGYWIPRRNFIVGREIRAGGFSPDHQLRLLRRGRAAYDLDREVHEVVVLDGSAGYLTTPLLHYNYRNWAQFHRKQRFYARYEARRLLRQGITPRPHNFVLQPLREFRRRFVSLQGWRDGIAGLRLAFLLAWYYGFVPYWLLRFRSPGAL